MKIEIKTKDKSPITEDIGEIEIGDMTIFAGPNNSGKTKLVKEIGQLLQKNNIHVIEIPAERVISEDEFKTGNQNDPFRSALSGLIDVAFDDASISSSVSDLDEAIAKEFDSFGVEKTRLKIKTKTAKENADILNKIIKETYIKNIIGGLCIEDGYCAKDDIQLSEAGQGTQRLVIAALLKYLGDKKFSKLGKEQVCIIFEEPEVFLHPKLKESLYESLKNITENSKGKIMVILTTHDPYFIELGKDYKIYKVSRNQEKGYSTDIEAIKDQSNLPYDSAAEINYLVFELPTKTYFLELYEYLKSQTNSSATFNYSDFDDILSPALGIQQDRDDDSKKHKISYITRIRHDLAHPNGDKSETFRVEGKKAIQGLIEYRTIAGIKTE